MNYPGAEIILERLKKFNETNLLVMSIERCVKEALMFDEQIWLENMAGLLDNEDIKANLPKDIFEVFFSRNSKHQEYALADYLNSTTVWPEIWKPKAAGGTTNAIVSSNTAWSASCNTVSWLAVSESNRTGSGVYINSGTLSLIAAANTSSVPRVGTITITAGNLSKIITVIQAAANTI